MIRFIVVLISALCIGTVSAQTSSVSGIKGKVVVSQELKEDNKDFFTVDLNYFTSENGKGIFIDLLASESRLFPVSTVRADNTILVCSHKSAISQADAIALLEKIMENANASSGQGGNKSSDKQKVK